MRFLLGLLFLAFAGGSSQATIIQIDYTGMYSGTMTTGNPAISEFTTVAVGPTPFSLTFVFDTLTLWAWHSDSSTSSQLSSFNYPSAGSAYGSFFFSLGGDRFAENIATTGSTSQTVVDQVSVKGARRIDPCSSV